MLAKLELEDFMAHRREVVFSIIARHNRLRMDDLNAIFNEFSRLFIGTIIDEKDVAFPEALNRQKLDGSVESLHEVDRYLTYLHKNQNGIRDEEWRITLLRAGAYLGEVIRHAGPEGEFRWVDYNDYMTSNPDLRTMIPDRTAATCAFLVRRTGAMSMPLNKIARFIEEGPENNVHFFASCDLKDYLKHEPKQ
jgi:hypothetical protein